MSESNGHAATRGDARSVVVLGMPSYGNMTSGAAQGFLRSSRCPDRDVRALYMGSSLPTRNFNALWCHAMTLAHRGERVDYFAMIHSDVEPGEGWLDTLIDELESKNLDVLGVVIPLKDNRGYTSTALARDDGDTWNVHARLTMREVYTLPETFTTEDVGRRLLINTGLWVCKFDMRWAPKVLFDVRHRICFDEKQGLYFDQVEPEDWYASRHFHALGLRVGCTRKVAVIHRGEAAYGNDVPWGVEFDQENLGPSGRSAVAGREPADWFPHNVPGWLTEEEGRKLAELAEGKTVLEVGAYCGRSTICLARGAKTVGVVDTFDGRGTATPGDTLPTFSKHLRRHNVPADRVNVYRGESRVVLEDLPPVYDLVFVDAAHDYASVSRDAELASALLRPGGLLAFHDYGRDGSDGNGIDFGVTQAVDDYVSRGAEIVERCGSIAVVRPPVGAGVPTEV